MPANEIQASCYILEECTGKDCVGLPWPITAVAERQYEVVRGKIIVSFLNFKI